MEAAVAVTVELPLVLRRFAQQAREVTVEAVDVDGALRALVQRHPALQPHLFLADGRRRQIVQVFVHGEPLPLPEGAERTLRAGERLQLVSTFAASWA